MLKGVLIAVVAMLTVACSERPVGAVVTDTPREVWHEGESVELSYDNRDTLSLFTLGVVARREVSYGGVALPLTVAVTAPSGLHFAGEVVLLPNDKHRGGSFVELRAAWISEARLGEEGTYRFRITPQSPLQGVWTVGVSVEQTER